MSNSDQTINPQPPAYISSSTSDKYWLVYMIIWRMLNPPDQEYGNTHLGWVYLVSIGQFSKLTRGANISRRVAPWCHLSSSGSSRMAGLHRLVAERVTGIYRFATEEIAGIPPSAAARITNCSELLSIGVYCWRSTFSLSNRWPADSLQEKLCEWF